MNHGVTINTDTILFEFLEIIFKRTHIGEFYKGSNIEFFLMELLPLIPPNNSFIICLREPRGMTLWRKYISKNLLSFNCSICKKHVPTYQELIQCPACSAPFHEDHFIEAIKVNGKCPI